MKTLVVTKEDMMLALQKYYTDLSNKAQQACVEFIFTDKDGNKFRLINNS